MRKDCLTCKYRKSKGSDEPCASCLHCDGDMNEDRWEPADKLGRLCDECFYDYPSVECVNCGYHHYHWTPKPKPVLPPLGVMPKFIWEERRLDEIIAAIKRHTDCHYLIRKELIDEYNELAAKQAERGK